jgi:CelD/BcsL family acetyltransferase involved in cellulose biosynthesis
MIAAEKSTVLFLDVRVTNELEGPYSEARFLLLSIRRAQQDSCHFGLSEPVRFAGLVQAARILIPGCPDGELIAADAQAARPAVVPLHKNLELVGVPDDAHPANAHLALLDPISLIWDLVVPLHDFSPGASSGKCRGLAAPSGRSLAPVLLD